ncbi:MAG TPA: Ldh family oxidoreductase [Thermodesulfobacteriota bacterium]
MPRVHGQDLERSGTEVFAALGAPREEAQWVSTLLVRSNLRGHDSHGVLRIPQYVEAIRAGQIRPGERPGVEERGPTTLVVDGRLGFGQVVAREAMALAVGRARAHGVAAVGIRRANHVGRLADFAEQAAAEGVVGLVFANDSGALQRVAPAGGIEGRLSTNPFAVGIPRRTPPHLVVDVSTSVVASGKLKAARDAGERVPEGWVQDAQGRPSTDPNVPFADPPGTILPMAGHKGYALALVVEVLAGVLSGAGFVRPDPGPDYQGAFLVALDVSRFLPLDRFVADVEAMLAHVKSARPRPGVPEVLVPGEHAWKEAERRKVEGIPLAEGTWAKLRAIAEALGVPLPAPVGPRGGAGS